MDGKPVGFMYRGPPGNDLDSGWRFFAGDESDAYVDDRSHFEIYDVNTVANHDPSIVAMLESPTLSAFERDETGGDFRASSFPDSE